MKTLLLLTLLLSAGGAIGQSPQVPGDAALARALQEAREHSAQVLRQGGAERSQAEPLTGTAPAIAPPAPNVDAALQDARSRSERILAQPMKPPAPSYRDVHGLPPSPGPRTAPNLPLELGKRADPASIAARFSQLNPASAAADHELLIFISTSMPKATLVRLGEQAKAAGGILVMRGIKGGLQQKNALIVTATELRPVAATGADIQIHPELFTRYAVGAVPTFVLARQVTDCGADTCDARMVSLVGDVSLDFALDRFTASPDEQLARLARAKLAQMERRP